MSYWEKIHSEKAEGFDIVLSIAPEDLDPSDLFDSSIDDIQKIYDDINSGKSAWFCVRVQAFKAGVELATDYLGGNLYDDPKDFLKDGYFEDLKYRVIEEAKKELPKLLEELAQ